MTPEPVPSASRNAPSFPLERREFLRRSALAFGAACLAPRVLRAQAATDAALFDAIGIAASHTQAADLASTGVTFLTESVNRFLVPDQPDEVFARHLEAFRQSPLPIRACNDFIRPPHLRAVGAEANHDAVLEWARVVFQRARQVGARFVVYGSSGSRALRDGWTKAQADEQFVALLKRMGPLARDHGLIVALEQLRREECNYINTAAEAAAIVRAVDDPNVRLLTDLYHMAYVGDTPEDLRAVMDVVVHVEIAEREGRRAPQPGGQDFSPYFRVLREAGYRGAISIEGNWTVADIGPAVEEIRRQAANA